MQYLTTYYFNLKYNSWLTLEIIFYPDDLSIVWFLRASKYDVERTKSYLGNFYSFRNRVTEWYEDRDPLKPELLDLLELG